jgi:hypothetical protein
VTENNGSSDTDITQLTTTFSTDSKISIDQSLPTLAPKSEPVSSAVFLETPVSPMSLGAPPVAPPVPSDRPPPASFFPLGGPPVVPQIPLGGPPVVSQIPLRGPPPAPPLPTGPPPAPPLPLGSGGFSLGPGSDEVSRNDNNELLASIRTGSKLKQVAKDETSPQATDSRSDLLAQIQTGTSLKKAHERKLPEPKANAKNAAAISSMQSNLKTSLARYRKFVQDEEGETGGKKEDWET